MMTLLSEHRCQECDKKLLKSLFVTLNDRNSDKTQRFCYECQNKIYGLNLNAVKVRGSAMCHYCDINLFKDDLFAPKRNYYIFTDMADSTQIVFCAKCFEENAPK